MKRTLLTAFAVAAMLANTSSAQVDLGGAISGAINGATGNAQPQVVPPQAPNAAPPKAAVPSGGANANVNAAAAVAPPIPVAPGTAAAGGTTTAGVNAGVNAAGTVSQAQTQGWLGQVGNDIRGALQQADNGIMRLQNNLNPSLPQRGFQPGDQLLDANGQPLTQAQFDQYLQSNPGQVRVLRNGQTVVINGNAQGNMQGSGRYNPYPGQPVPQGAMQPAGRQRFGITMNPSSEGVMVAGVTVGSPAAQAGIRPGDQIISVNDQEITNPNSMIQVVNATQSDQTLDVQYRRNGELMRSQVTLANNGPMTGGVYQAGYPQGTDNRSGAHADMNARLDQLERMVQDLRDQVEKLSKSEEK